jgi:hypothetical protein
MSVLVFLTDADAYIYLIGEASTYVLAAAGLVSGT